MQISIVSYNIEGITLEMNYCNDPSQHFKKYIIEKSNYLNIFLSNLNVDIICIQEYTAILNIKLEKYFVVKENRHAIYFLKNKFKYVDHITNNDIGLVVILNMNGFYVNIGTNRLLASNENKENRNEIMNKIDSFSKNKIIIFAIDTNMRNSEEKIMNNLTDCYYNAKITNGFYTLNKTTNPYFANDNNKKFKFRYDKIFFSDFFDCEQLNNIIPKTNSNLVNSYYPYGNLSDHYPVLAILSIN